MATRVRLFMMAPRKVAKWATRANLALKVIFDQEQSLGGGSSHVDIAGSLGEKSLHLLLRHLQVEALHLLLELGAGRQTAHQEALRSPEAKEDKAETALGSNHLQGKQLL